MAASGVSSANDLRATHSLVAKLAVLVTAIIALLLAVLLAGGWLFWRKILREQIDARLSAIVESRRDFVREWIGGGQDRAELYASRGILRGWAERYVDGRHDEPQRTQSQANLDDHVASGAALVARVTDLAGRVILSSDPSEVGRDYSMEPAFVNGLKTPSVGLPQRVAGRFTVLTGAPITRRDAGRETIAVALLTLDATAFAEALRATTGLGVTGDVVLAVREGGEVRYILAPRYREEDIRVPFERVPAMAAAIEGRPFLGISQDYRGETVLAAARPVGFGGWGLVAKMDAREAYAPIALAGRYALGLGGLVGCAGLVAALLLAHNFMHPIRGLADAAARVAARDYEITVPVKGTDELGILAARFNEMIVAIRAHKAERDVREAEVRESREWLRLAQKAALAGTWEWNWRDNQTVWSDELWSLYGLEPYSCPSTFANWIQTIIPEDRDQVVHTVHAAARAGSEITVEWRVRYRDGTEHWLFARGQPQRDGTGDVYRYLGIVLDITARKQAETALREVNEQLETRVAERTAELRETVAELERFSYSVSHDMRSPLRAMEGYARLLLEEYGEKFEAEGRRYLERIVAAATRQGRLISDVLSYSGVVRGQFHIQPVDLDRLVEDIFHHYPNLREDENAIVVRSPLGSVLGHDVLLTQCLSNLLGNALKFMPAGREPRVIVRSERESGVVLLWIEDNGIGIAPEHHAKIFEMLERVHTEREYDGTGIGLTIVRKAVHRMGGDIGVISAPGEGSRFWLRLRPA